MTATMHSATVNSDGVQLLDETSGLLRDLDAFLRDPIGYGDYDFADPITLVEFGTTRHVHRRYAEALS